MELIKTLYFDLRHIISDVEYLGQRVILVITNVNVEIINNHCINRLRGLVVQKWSSNRAVDLEMVEEFPPECFHHYDEASLPLHRLSLKVDMLVMLLRNIRPPVMCNETRVRITRIAEHVLKAEIIADKSQGTSILISRIPLNSKDDEVNKNRRKTVPCQFTRRQYSIRSAFDMTINKSQGQSLRYVGIDIQTRECFTHGQLYVAVFKVTKKCNLYMITSETGPLDALRLIRNIQWKEVLLPPSVPANEFDGP